MDRVVITGIGIYSCLGKNVDEVKNSLFTGKSGIRFDQKRKDEGFRSGLTGYVERPNLKPRLDRKLRNNLAEQGEYAFVATEEALNMAKLGQDYIAENEVGIIFGNDSSALPVIESADIIREKKSTVLLGSNYIFQSMNSTVTMNLAVIFKVKGINFTISAACASGSHSIGIGYLLIQHGYQNIVVCGGAQEINWYSMGNFDALSAFSVRESDPEKASRPFDKDRDGLVPSGGAACVILESYESAKQRGADILGEVIGYGFSSDGNHISKPDVAGAKRSIMKAVKQSGVSLKEIDYINAHATSTLVGDANEAKAISEVFGDVTPHISSTKSMTGHECWMAGASEIVYSLIMMKESFIAPNINFENPDEFSAKLNIVTSTLQKKLDVVLSNSFGFGGTNSTLIIRKLNE
jgi:3-oxoacyl-[acyl-carrier-protein] synthase-1